jgi:dienelactone hydrolase
MTAPETPESPEPFASAESASSPALPETYSPSHLHRMLLDAHPPRLSYDGGDLADWQARLRPEIRRCLGEMPAERCDLNPRTLWRRETAEGTIEKLVFTAEPGADVPAWMCLPRDARPPCPLFICLQGHSSGGHNSIGVDRDDNSRPIEVPGDRDFARSAMANGFAALCIEQRAFGERREMRLHQVETVDCHDAACHALLLGRTLMGERVWDVQRGLDYLATRGDVDMTQIGVMGNSGGGTITVFAAAVLEGIAWAMPSCYFCTFRESILSVHHCVDNYLPGLARVAEMADVMALHAPKPVVVVAGQSDRLFPIDATRREFDRLRELYAAAGATDRCRLVVGGEGHRFYADQAWPVMRELAGM